MNIFLTILISILSVNCCFAQNYSSYIKFDTKQKDIGTVYEENGTIKIDFKFTNTGTQPLIINKVKTPTIKLKADWTQHPILPQKTGVITLYYNPAKEKGNFKKAITIFSNAKNNITIINIVGHIIPRPLTPEELYPVVLNQLRFKAEGAKLFFNNIKNTENKKDTIHFINYSNNNVTISFKEVPKHIFLNCIPQTLTPKQKGIITVEFDARKIEEYGYTYERISLGINNVFNYQNELAINAIIEEDFSKLTKEQIENAPNVEFTNTKFNFGNIEHGRILTHKFFFKNTGKSDLIIRKIKLGCGCTTYTNKKQRIKPNEESFIEVRFNSQGRRGRQHKFITFITNAPVNSTIKLEIIGNITNIKK